MAVHEAAAIAVGAVLRALIVGGFYAERDLAGALRLAAVAVTELPNSMVRTVSLLLCSSCYRLSVTKTLVILDAYLSAQALFIC